MVLFYGVRMRMSSVSKKDVRSERCKWDADVTWQRWFERCESEKRGDRHK